MPKSTPPANDPHREVAVGIFQLIAIRMEDMETTYLPDCGEVISVVDMNELLKGVRDDIFDELQYKQATREVKEESDVPTAAV